MSKAGVVQKAKKPIGSQGFDYWLPLREAIIKLHRQNAVPSTLSNVLDDLDKRKLDNYRECITGYKQWLKRKRLNPFPGRQRSTWSSAGLTVGVKPELILERGHERLAVKLYFSRPPLSRVRLQIYYYLVHRVAGTSMRPAVLDVRRGKLHVGNPRTSRDVDIALSSEASLFHTYWDAA